MCRALFCLCSICLFVTLVSRAPVFLCSVWLFVTLVSSPLFFLWSLWLFATFVFSLLCLITCYFCVPRTVFPVFCFDSRYDFCFFFALMSPTHFFCVFCLIVKFLVRNCFGFSLFCLIINSIPPILSIVVFSLIVTSVALCVAVCFVQWIHVFLSCVYISKSPYFTRFSFQ